MVVGRCEARGGEEGRWERGAGGGAGPWTRRVGGGDDGFDGGDGALAVEGTVGPIDGRVVVEGRVGPIEAVAFGAATPGP